MAKLKRPLGMEAPAPAPSVNLPVPSRPLHKRAIIAVRYLWLGVYTFCCYACFIKDDGWNILSGPSVEDFTFYSRNDWRATDIHSGMPAKEGMVYCPLCKQYRGAEQHDELEHKKRRVTPGGYVPGMGYSP